MINIYLIEGKIIFEVILKINQRSREFLRRQKKLLDKTGCIYQQMDNTICLIEKNYQITCYMKDFPYEPLLQKSVHCSLLCYTL